MGKARKRIALGMVSRRRTAAESRSKQRIYKEPCCGRSETVTLTFEVLLILGFIALVLAIREVLQFYRWTDHVRRMRSNYLLANVPTGGIWRDDLYLGP
jgi:hypothetical protein